jgi:hypothetical protein
MAALLMFTFVFNIFVLSFLAKIITIVCDFVGFGWKNVRTLLQKDYLVVFKQYECCVSSFF